MVQSDQNPTDAEWDAHLDAHRHWFGHPEGFRVLVATQGAIPTADQQRRMRAYLTANRPRVAVMSSAVRIRFVATVRLVNPNLGCYSPEQRREAFAHLGLSSDAAMRVRAVLDRLQGELAAAKASAA